MLTTGEMRQALQVHRVSTVAFHTGVNRNTISLIKQGHDTNLTQKTVKALSDYLAPQHPSVRAGE